MFEYAWYPLLLLITTPYFLHVLGSEKYGDWMLLTATVGLGGVLNTGTGAATIKAVSERLGREQHGEVGQAIRTSLGIALAGGAILGAIAFASFWAGSTAWFSKMGEPSVMRLTGLAAAILIWLEQLDNVFASAIKGAEEYGRGARVEILSKTLQTLVVALTVKFAPTLWALYAALVAVAMLRLFAKYAIAKHLFGLTSVRPSMAGATLDVLHFAKWGWLQGVGTTLFNVADRLLIGSLLGASSLTYYSIASQLAMQVHASSAASLGIVFPKVSRKLQSEGGFSLWRLTRLAATGSFLLSTALAGILILYGRKLLFFWIGAEATEPTSHLLVWLVFAYWVLALCVVPYYILMGLGQVRFIGVTVLAAGSIGVAAMYVAVLHFGLDGSVVGRCLYALISTAMFYPLIRHLRQTYSRSSFGSDGEQSGYELKP
jgi:O-antigen/teichoic acid export membrane protein